MALSGVSASVFAAGFGIATQSAGGTGNAYAAGAASIEDASAMWQNAAALSMLTGTQAVAGLHVITPSIKFRNRNSQAATFQPLGNSGGDAGSTVIVPDLYFTVPLNNAWTFGLGVNSPFGLIDDYNDTWIGRFQGVKSDVKTINVNPALSWKINDQLALGAGVNWQRIDATFTSRVNYSGALAQAAGAAAAQGLIPAELVPSIVAATPGLSARSQVEGSDSAWGWNVGALWRPTPSTRVGASYRSEIKYKVKGNVSFGNPQVNAPAELAPVVGLLASTINSTALFNGDITSSITLPAIANVSAFAALNDRWDVMGDVQFTQWSKLTNLTFTRTTGSVLQSTPENFKNTWRVSLGANYKVDDAWKLRVGVAWDQTPVNNTDRTVRLPDGDRYWLAGGARWTMSKNFAFDVGATYIWVKRAGISQNAGSTASNGFVDGRYDANVVVVSGQLVYTF
jgi:long-chain fatty acid transport protein